MSRIEPYDTFLSDAARLRGTPDAGAGGGVPRVVLGGVYLGVPVPGYITSI